LYKIYGCFSSKKPIIGAQFDVFSVAPQVPDPFQTLADIYEAKGDTDKRMQVCFLLTV